MFNRTEGLEPERLLPGKGSLETSPPELRQTLAYILRLRACWNPEGRAKLVVPTSWKAFLPCADNKCGAACAGARHVRFKTRPVAPAEDVPHDVVSQVLTHVGMADSMARCVSRAFEGTPRTRQVCRPLFLQRSHDGQASDVPATRRTFSQSTQHVDFALVPEHASDDTHLLLGINGSDLEYLPGELTRLATRALSGPFPEWLVLFVLVYDARRLRIVAYVPRRRQASDEIDCAPYVVDELAFRSSFTGCELVLERLRFLSAMRTLRRHVHHLSLFTPIRRISNCSACDRDALSDGLGSSQHCSSEYSTCPSIVYSRGTSDRECGLSSSSGSFSSSYCSTCLSVLESASCDSIYSQESKYMEPSMVSLYQGEHKSINYPSGLTETRRREIIAWTQQVIPAEHPVKDNYRMVIDHLPSTSQRVKGRGKDTVRHDQLRNDR